MAQQVNICHKSTAQWRPFADTGGDGRCRERLIAESIDHDGNAAGKLAYSTRQYRDAPTQAALPSSSEGSGWRGGNSRPEGQTVTESRDRPLHRRLRSRKVAKIHLSRLAHWILQHAGAGIARSAIAEGLYGIEPLYCGYYVDPCLSARARQDRQIKCRRIQPRITKTLRCLESHGLVELIRERRYVKSVQLTRKGRRLANELKDRSKVAGHDH